MTAPDSDAESKPEGISLPPEALAAGQRTLAAIIFTDTVGFSALMSKDEERALRLVARDLDFMKSLCESFGGRVLKSTGDGLLMLFTSAVQAVACALEIQRDIQKHNLELPRSEQLQHRIGIHLGDIFQQGGDVMGDGVNIAARLQTQAVPGGICLSKTVYDVVQNRLQFYVNDLGARKLKNIGMVTAYQISPSDGGAGQRVAWYLWRPWIWRAVWLAVALLILVLAYGLGIQHQHAVWLRTHPAAQRNATVAPETPPPQAATNPLPATDAAPFNPPPSNPASPASGLIEASETEFNQAHYQYMQKYDFDGMQMWIKTHDWPGKSTSKLSETCGQLQHLFNWCYSELQKYPDDEPLVVVGKAKSFAFSPAPFGGIKITVDGKQRILSRDQMPPLSMVGLANELIKENSIPGDPQTQLLQRQLQLFIRVYKIELPGKTSSPSTNAPTTIAPGVAAPANP